MLRLTGGTFRGRSLLTPSHTHTRPTQAKLRQALFNSLQTLIPNARVLDLFAGSGALGFEALSRGASESVFVESTRSVSKLIQQNASALEVQSQCQIVSETVETACSKGLLVGPFQVILADPPYDGGFEMVLLETLPWQSLLDLDGCFCLEWGKQKSLVRELPERVSCLVKVREKIYGDSVLTTYRRSPE